MQTTTFNLSLPADLLKKADQVAKQEYRNRSELFREALRAYIDEKNRWGYLRTLGFTSAQKMKIRSDLDVEKIIDSIRK